MKKNHLLLAIVALFGLLGYASCGASEEDQLLKEALIEQTYQDRVAKYEKEHHKKCRKNVLTTAKILADSTLLDNARNIKVVDSIQRPPKPLKPGFPEAKSLDDSLEIAPFLEKPSLDTINLSDQTTKEDSFPSNFTPK